MPRPCTKAVLHDHPYIEGFRLLIAGKALLGGVYRGGHCKRVRDVRGWGDPLVDDLGLGSLGVGPDRFYVAFPASGHERIPGAQVEAGSIARLRIGEGVLVEQEAYSIVTRDPALRNGVLAGHDRIVVEVGFGQGYVSRGEHFRVLWQTQDGIHRDPPQWSLGPLNTAARGLAVRPVAMITVSVDSRWLSARISESFSWRSPSWPVCAVMPRCCRRFVMCWRASGV